MVFSWSQLPRPFFVLAPMEGATDTVFRQLIAQLAPPDVFFTEFTSIQGMYSRGNKHVVHRLRFDSNNERPLVAQVWGNDPSLFERVGADIEARGFDGMDINMGCPERTVIKKGMCAGLIRTPELACEIIQAAQRGLSNIPLSIKTRIGFDQIEIDSWIRLILERKPAALTIHLRTVKEMSLVPAHWELAPRIAQLRNEISPETILIGNGDVSSRAQGIEKVHESGFDGIMIGRGVFHNPYVFSETKSLQNLTRTQKLELLGLHINMFENTWADEKNCAILKRFVKIYITGFADAAALRDECMRTHTIEQLRQLITENGKLKTESC